MFLGPADRWPKHPRPLAREALEEARLAGWYLRPSDGHAFGRLRCVLPDDDPDGVACKVPVYSTSGRSDGSDTALVIRDALRKCRHHLAGAKETGPDSPEAAARLAAGGLVRLELLLEAADRLVDKVQSERQSDELVTAALQRLDEDPHADIAELDEQRADLDERAATEGGRAYSAACRADAADPWPPVEGARTLIGLASGVLADITNLVAAASGADEASRLVVERDRLRHRLHRVSSRAAALA